MTEFEVLQVVAVAYVVGILLAVAIILVIIHFGLVRKSNVRHLGWVDSDARKIVALRNAEEKFDPSKIETFKGDIDNLKILTGKNCKVGTEIVVESMHNPNGAANRRVAIIVSEQPNKDVQETFAYIWKGTLNRPKTSKYSGNRMIRWRVLSE